MTGGEAVGALIQSAQGYLQGFISDWAAILAVPIGILAFGMLGKVVMGAMAKKD